MCAQLTKHMGRCDYAEFVEVAFFMRGLKKLCDIPSKFFNAFILW